MHAQALAIIESYCGQSFGTRQVNERISLKSNIGRLTHTPFVRIDAVSVRCSQWAYASVFGSTEWAPIPPNDVLITEKNTIVVPGGVLDAHFTEADVTYTIGYTELPAAIARARDLLADKISSGGARSTYSMSALITPEIAELLAPFILSGGDAN